MKKSILLLLFTFVTMLSFSQIESVSPKLGITYSGSKGIENSKFKPGYLWGATVDYSLMPKISFRTGLLIEQKGCQGRAVYLDENGWQSGILTWYNTWNYLTLPLQIKYSPFRSKNFFLAGGGYAGYLLAASQRFKSDNPGKLDGRDKLDLQYYNRWDIGLQTGAGLRIPVGGKNSLEFDLLYDYAFRVDKGRMPPATSTFSFTVGYSFALSR